MSIKDDDIVTAVAVSIEKSSYSKKKEPIRMQRQGSKTFVARGKHSVPAGVAVEELQNFNGKKDLKNCCPIAVRELLVSKGAFGIYENFVQTIYNDKTTRGPLGGWRDAQFVSVVDKFRGTFAWKGLKVVLCKRESDGGTFRWIEYIDVSQLGSSYVPQYDVSNRSGQVIKTYSTKLRFPNGVAVEQLKSYKPRKVLQESIPTLVHEMMDQYGLMPAYKKLIDDCVAFGGASQYDAYSWKTASVQALVEKHQKVFREKNIDLYVCKKTEYISHGQFGGDYEYFRWIEFVDRSLQPNYVAQRDAAARGKQGDGCLVM